MCTISRHKIFFFLVILIPVLFCCGVSEYLSYILSYMEKLEGRVISVQTILPHAPECYLL